MSLSALWLMKPSPRHSKCGRSSNTSPSSAMACGLPSSRTTRLYWFSTSQRPSRICASSMCTDCRMSSGSKPATTIGLPYTSGTNRYGRLPTTVDTWPGPRKPDSRRSGESRIALIGGTIVTWLQNTVKFGDAELLGAHQRHRGRRRRRLEADREEHDLLVGVLDRDAQRVERRVHEADVGAARLRLEQAAPAAGHPHHVAEGGEDDVRAARPATSRHRRGPSGSRTPGSPARAPARCSAAGCARSRAGRWCACARRTPP